ncbi:hypothetical protein LLEC1_07483 [Akanthomyces lecanii]|uniref:Methyltransferase type 11 domain-containing protein n=1 Tax=Cordyceps confragosa TaxID=2714763 RepID=A0A179I467_CORDF|nr:hypothetical protein LLEC1_07483 [Akanthomyces lecanii]
MPATGPSPDTAAEGAKSPDDAESPVINTQIPFIPHDSDDDNDSALGDDSSIASSSASLTDSIFEYRALHGRTYQVSKSTEYWGPNDEAQNEGLDLAHALVTMLMGDRLFAAPLAARAPTNPSWVPPNCTFYLDDAQLDWTFDPASFDFVHIRALYGSINDWPRLYAQAHDALMPGGWIENFELTILLRSDAPHVRDDPQHIFKRWADVFCEAGDRLDRTLRIGNNYTMHRLLHEAGFEDVTQKYYQVPVGGWSSDPVYKKIGIYNLAFMEQSLEGFALFLLREIMKWTYERVQVFLMEMRAEIRNTKIRPYYLMTNAYARKPE